MLISDRCQWQQALCSLSTSSISRREWFISVLSRMFAWVVSVIMWKMAAMAAVWKILNGPISRLFWTAFSCKCIKFHSWIFLKLTLSRSQKTASWQEVQRISKYYSFFKLISYCLNVAFSSRPYSVLAILKKFLITMPYCQHLLCKRTRGPHISPLFRTDSHNTLWKSIQLANLEFWIFPYSFW